MPSPRPDYSKVLTRFRDHVEALKGVSRKEDVSVGWIARRLIAQVLRGR